MSKNRSWCFTLNNYTEFESEAIKGVQCKYLVFGFEEGENGTPHLQGYITFNSPITLSAIKKKSGFERCHLEVAKGSADSNFDYCTKDNDYYEKGERPKRGKRTDIEVVKEMIIEGKPMKEICMAATSYQSLRFAETMRKYHEIERRWKPNVYWFWGASGTGKSKTADEMFPDAYRTLDTHKWWEGYDGHENVIIDDMRGDFCKFHILLKILDRYPFRVETKGGSRQLLAKNIVITSCYSPERMFDKSEEDLKQLLRRIDEIRFFDSGTEHGTEVVGNTEATTNTVDR